MWPTFTPYFYVTTGRSIQHRLRFLKRGENKNSNDTIKGFFLYRLKKYIKQKTNRRMCKMDTEKKIIQESIRGYAVMSSTSGIKTNALIISGQTQTQNDVIYLLSPQWHFSVLRTSNTSVAEMFPAQERHT